MPPISRRDLFAAALASAPAVLGADRDGWVPLFDGNSLNGWKASEREGSFRVEGGQIVADGPRSHLFYTGPIRSASFKNFEFRAEVLTRPDSNSGIYFHTRYQPQGWPASGFEVQINNTHRGEGTYRERKKTGSLYGVRNVYKQLVKDGEWFRMHILVRGKQVQIRINDALVVDYIEPDPPIQVEKGFERALGRGTFALQAHNQGSRAYFRNIAVRPLPDDAPPLASDKPVADAIYRQILEMSAANFPVVDYHVHLKGGLTIEDALRESRRLGIGYGVAVNCGVSFPIHDDAGVLDFLQTVQGKTVFTALQGEGREWPTLLRKDTIAKFDYVFTDSMTFTDDNGKRMRTWIPSEVGEIPDKQKFTDMVVNRAVGILNREPIDIYANPTYLPDAISADYDALWTESRMHRVIEAAKKNDVAIEINNRYRIPHAPFIKLAKAAGVKFSFGTNNSDAQLGRLEYSLQMVKECGLKWQDIFVPRRDGEKPVQRKA